MRYVDISRVKPDEVRIRNKRFWTAQGDRITAWGFAAFTAAVNQSATKHKQKLELGRGPTHARKYATQKPIDTAMLKTLLAFGEEMGWSATRTGRELAKDANLVHTVRMGRHITPARAQRLADRIEELRQCREHSSEKPTPTPS